jgi:hypothetical protein
MSGTHAPITSDEKLLVLARLSTLPTNMGIAVGNEGPFTIAEIKEHVESEDDLGRQYIEMQLEFLRSIKDGSLFD